MRKHEAHPGRFLRQDDLEKPILVTIQRVEMQPLEGDSGTTQKPIAHFIEPNVSPMVINKINWDTLEEGLGLPDSDDWPGSGHAPPEVAPEQLATSIGAEDMGDAEVPF